MRRRLLLLVVVMAILAMIVAVPKVIHLETYIVSPASFSSWVEVQYGVDGCPAIEKNWFGVTARIPASGYLCTSTPMPNGLTYWRYYVEDAGKSKRLDLDRDIFHVTAGTVTTKNCRIDGHAFWYGSRESMTTRAFADGKRHLECTEVVPFKPVSR